MLTHRPGMTAGPGRLPISRPVNLRQGCLIKMLEVAPDFNGARLAGPSADLRDQTGQSAHIVEGGGGPGLAQAVIVTWTAMAAAVKAEHGHSGGAATGDAG